MESFLKFAIRISVVSAAEPNAARDSGRVPCPHHLNSFRALARTSLMRQWRCNMVPFQFRKYGATDQLRLGWASWDEDRSEVPVKYTWFDKLGGACRGGSPYRSDPGHDGDGSSVRSSAWLEVGPDELKALADFIAAMKKKLPLQPA